jgi:hypothetical protein
MPAWMTSELREEVSSPKLPFFSNTMTDLPATAKARPTARPTAPAPTIMTSISATTKPHGFPLPRLRGNCPEGTEGGYSTKKDTPSVCYAASFSASGEAVKRSQPSSLNTRANGARHAGSANSAIAARIFGQILLMIVFGIIKLWCHHDFGSHRAKA